MTRPLALLLLAGSLLLNGVDIGFVAAAGMQFAALQAAIGCSPLVRSSRGAQRRGIPSPIA